MQTKPSRRPKKLRATPKFVGEDEPVELRPSGSTSSIFLKCSPQFFDRVSAASKALGMNKSEVLRFCFVAVMSHLDKILQPELDRLLDEKNRGINSLPLAAFATAEFSTEEIRQRLLERFDLASDPSFAAFFNKDSSQDQIKEAGEKLVDGVMAAATAEYQRALREQRDDAMLSIIAGDDPVLLDHLRTAREMGSRSAAES